MINKIRISCIAATIILMLISMSTVSLAATLTVPTLVGNYDTAGHAVDIDVLDHYAYVADQINGLIILDISTPSLPSLVGSYNTGTHTYGIAVSGDYAYVTDDENGLLILDISNPSSPVLMGSYNNPPNYYGARHVYISGNYAYVTYITGGLVILDISNPSLPTFVGKYSDKCYQAYGVTVVGNYAYVTDIFNGLVILDISNPYSPALVGKYDTSGEARDVIVSGNYAYISDMNNGVVIIDVSNPSSPTLVCNYGYISYVYGDVHSLSIRGNYAYVCAVPLVILDITNPSSLSVVSAPVYGGDGARSVDLVGNYAYVVRGTSGLLIYQVNTNSPPVAKAVEDCKAEEGSPITFDAKLSNDPDGDALQYRWDFESDGIWDTQWSDEPVATHTWDDDWSGSAKLEVSDGELTSIDTATVAVNNVNPILNIIVSTVDPVLVNTPVKTSCTFTDAGTKDTHTGTWDWIEGVSSSGSVTESSGEGTVTGEHTYADPGIYRVSLAVTDNNGGTASATAENYVVVYDPQGGFVTGGGWINSPAGAYVPDNTLAGKATFGFVSKYEKGATVPTGKTEFQFKVADLNFHSENYDWLVVAGSQAKYKGTGTINGEGNYGFMLSAIDGAIKGDNIDKFRIKIWDKESGNTIYDNEIGIGEDAEPSTAIGGGSIIIHK